jgi:hypothetical protein
MEVPSNNASIINSHTSAIFPTLKKCARCPYEKPLSEFNNRRDARDGKQSYCRLCQEDDRLLRRYHITCQQRDLMYVQQQGQCASCHGFYLHLYIYAIEGLGVISLVCPRCLRICHGFHRHPDIIMSAIDYLNYFGSRVLYRVEVRFLEAWEAQHTGEPQRKTRHRSYPRGVNPETYDHWSLWNNHLCYICWEPRSTGRKFARDHQHVTNRNRGLLCFSCNRTLGIAEDDTALLHACAKFPYAYLDPYIAGWVRITDAMVADADEEAPWVSRAYSAALPA